MPEEPTHIVVKENSLRIDLEQLRDALTASSGDEVVVPNDRGTELVMTRANAMRLLAEMPGGSH
jgi:hypothetical protein